MMIHYSSLLSLLLLWTSEAQKSGCDLKDAECLDEKQVFFQLRSEVSDSKDSERSVAAQRRWRWRRRNRRYHPYHPYGPNTTTTTTTTIPVCGEESIGVANFTSVDLPPGENVTVLLEVNQEVVKGCCVEDFQNTIDLDVSYSNPAGSLGNFTVFLETPDMQSKEVGVAFASQSPFGFDGNLFPGAVAGGTWTLTLLASPDAVGWSSFFSQIGIQLEQCVWLTRICQERWVLQLTAKVSNECLGRCVSEVWFLFICPMQIDDFRWRENSGWHLFMDLWVCLKIKKPTKIPKWFIWGSHWDDLSTFRKKYLQVLFFSCEKIGTAILGKTKNLFFKCFARRWCPTFCSMSRKQLS